MMRRLYLKKLILTLASVIVFFFAGWFSHATRTSELVSSHFVFDHTVPVFNEKQIFLLKKYYTQAVLTMDEPWMFYPSHIEQKDNGEVFMVMSYLELLQNGIDSLSGLEISHLDGEYSIYLDSSGVLLRKQSDH